VASISFTRFRYYVSNRTLGSATSFWKILREGLAYFHAYFVTSLVKVHVHVVAAGEWARTG
jgi:hypothetical protein